MSGSASASPSFPTSLEVLPPQGANAEGSRYIQIKLQWGIFPGVAGPNYTRYTTIINLLSQFNAGRFTTPQAVYIDNQTCPYPTTVTCQESGMRIIVPAFAAGMYPLTMAAAPVLIAQIDIPVWQIGTLAPGTTQMIVFNTPQKYFTLPQTVYQTGFLSSIISAVVTTPNLGLISTFGEPYHMAITGIRMELNTSQTWPGSGSVFVNLQESAPATGPAWEDAFFVYSGGTGQSYYTNITFPNPLVQLTAGSSYQLSLSQIPTGAGTTYVLFTLSFGLLVIQ